MNDLFALPVSYQGRELEFPFKVIAHGYMTRYVIIVGDVEVSFEKDDFGELRAVIYDQDQLQGKLPERALLQAITETLQQLTG